MSMDDADLVSAALRAQEAGQVRQVEPEKRRPEEHRGKPGQEEQKSRRQRGDYFEKSEPQEEGEASPDAATEGTPTSDESEGEEEERKRIDTLA